MRPPQIVIIDDLAWPKARENKDTYQAGYSKDLQVTSQELRKGKTFLWSRLTLYCILVNGSSVFLFSRAHSVSIKYVDSILFQENILKLYIFINILFCWFSF